MKIIKIASKLFPDLYKQYTSFIASYGFIAVDHTNELENKITLYLDPRYTVAAQEAGINFDKIENLPRENCTLNPFEWSIQEFKRFKFSDYKLEAVQYEQGTLNLSEETIEMYKKFLAKNSGKRYLVSTFAHITKPMQAIIIDSAGNFSNNLGDDVLFDPFITPLAYLENLNIQNAVQDPIRISDAIIENENEFDEFMNQDCVAWLFLWQHVEENYTQMSEMDVANFLQEAKEKVHKECGKAFETIAGNNSNAALIHGRASEKRLEEGVLLIDAGASIGKFKSDTTRVFWLGNQANISHEIKQAYTNVLKAHIKVVTANLAKNESVGKLDDLAREYVHFDHALGHGVGKNNVHAFPTISKNSSDLLTEGMVLAIEPGFYEAGKFGIRLESLVRTKEFSENFYYFEYLTYLPFEYDLIINEQLDEIEKAWLSNFHKICYKKLVDSEFLDKEAKEFLKEKTQKFI